MSFVGHSLRTLVTKSVTWNSARSRLVHTTSAVNMPIKAGDKLPSVNLFEGAPDNVVNTSVFSKGKTVIFGVPGAFTPTCTKEHVPSFVNTVSDLKSKGANNIVCVAVNDPFVMAAFGKTIDPSGNIQFLADTCAEFSKALDLTIDVTAVLGNIRCKRFALVVEDGIVKGVNVEPDGIGLSCSRGQDVLKLL